MFSRMHKLHNAGLIRAHKLAGRLHDGIVSMGGRERDLMSESKRLVENTKRNRLRRRAYVCVAAVVETSACENFNQKSLSSDPHTHTHKQNVYIEHMLVLLCPPACNRLAYIPIGNAQPDAQTRNAFLVRQPVGTWDAFIKSPSGKTISHYIHFVRHMHSDKQH